MRSSSTRTGIRRSRRQARDEGTLVLSDQSQPTASTRWTATAIDRWAPFGGIISSLGRRAW
jgi:hypothetical protein